MGFSIDGTTIKSVTVDGNTVKEIVVDGTTVWTAAEGSILVSNKLLDPVTGDAVLDISPELDRAGGTPYVVAADSAYFFSSAALSEIRIKDAADPNTQLATCAAEDMSENAAVDGTGNGLIPQYDSNNGFEFEKYDQSGNRLWIYSKGTGPLAAYSDDEFYGVFGSSSNSRVTRYNSDGTNDIYTEFNAGFQNPRIAVDKDKNVFVFYHDTNEDGWLLKADKDLNLIFDTRFVTNISDFETEAIDTDDSGNAVVAFRDRNVDDARVFVLDGGNGSELKQLDLFDYDSSDTASRVLEVFVDKNNYIITAVNANDNLYVYSYSIPDGYTKNFIKNVTSEYGSDDSIFGSRHGKRGRR